MANITIRNFKVYNKNIYPAIMFEISYKDTSLIDKDDDVGKMRKGLLCIVFPT
jgi:hypothetical protein